MKLEQIKELQQKLENIGGQGVDFGECFEIAKEVLNALELTAQKKQAPPMLAVGDVLDAGTSDERIIVQILGGYVYFVRPSRFHDVRQWPEMKCEFTTVHRPRLIWQREVIGS